MRVVHDPICLFRGSCCQMFQSDGRILRRTPTAIHGSYLLMSYYTIQTRG